MKRMKRLGSTLLCGLLLVTPFSGQQSSAEASEQSEQGRQMEYLDRGVVAVKVDEGVFVSWRWLGTESKQVTFNLYRDDVKVNDTPITSSTNYLDSEGTEEASYSVSAVVDGEEQPKSEPVQVWGESYHAIPLQKPDGGVTPDGVSYTYHANDASVGDLDGDGEYEIVLKWNPSNAKDNAHNGYTGEVFIDAYKLDGTQMWRIGLGKNIRAGAHYTQFMVYDLDGDGKAEVALRTADGATDSQGTVIGDADADYRNEQGRILEGPEFLSIFDGESGEVMVTTDFEPARGDGCDWGDCYGNRVDRFLAGIAYLDGEKPSLIMTRGYYEKTMLVAYNYRDGQLEKLWTFDTDTPGNEGYVGQGNHQLSVGDVDGDGRDEIIFGAMTIDHDGQGLYTTGLNHGDALHFGNLDPSREGLEVFGVHESGEYGITYRDAQTGEILWGVKSDQDIGRGMSADIDPRHLGEEVWASHGMGLYTAKGEKLSDDSPASIDIGILQDNSPTSINFGIWWDADLSRELLDHDWHGWDVGYGTPKIDKWDYHTSQLNPILVLDGTASNNGTKGTPTLQADILGDWREEVIVRDIDSSELRVYTTTDITDHRIYTLMHDTNYRLGIAWQNVAYNQPPHPSFYLGNGMDEPPTPNVYQLVPAEVNVTPHKINTKKDSQNGTLMADITLPTQLHAAIEEVYMKVNDQVIAGELVDSDQQTKAKFNRQDIKNLLQEAEGSVDVKVTGSLSNGDRYVGQATLEAVHE